MATLEHDLCLTIVAALQVVMTPEEAEGRGRRPKVDPAAYDLFVRGRAELYKFTEPSVAAWASVESWLLPPRNIWMR